MSLPQAEFTRQDAEALLSMPQFRRFLFAAIQSAGIVSITSPANGQSSRPLEWFEGRRSLGFDLLRMADTGQPEPLQSPEALATLGAAVREALNPPPKEKTRGRRNDDNARYDDLPD